MKQSLGDIVATQMQKNLGWNKPLMEKEASISVPNTHQDVIYTLSSISRELDDMGFAKSSIDVLNALKTVALELEDFGLQSRDEDNIEEALERNPEARIELTEELEQDPDVEPLNRNTEEEFLEDVELERAEDRILDLLSEDNTADEHLDELIREWYQDNDQEQYEEPDLEWDSELDFDFSNDIDKSFNPFEKELNIDLGLEDLLQEDNLDSHLADVLMDRTVKLAEEERYKIPGLKKRLHAALYINELLLEAVLSINKQKKSKNEYRQIANFEKIYNILLQAKKKLKTIDISAVERIGKNSPAGWELFGKINSMLDNILEYLMLETGAVYTVSHFLPHIDNIEKINKIHSKYSGWTDVMARGGYDGGPDPSIDIEDVIDRTIDHAIVRNDDSTKNNDFESFINEISTPKNLEEPTEEPIEELEGTDSDSDEEFSDLDEELRALQERNMW